MDMDIESRRDLKLLEAVEQDSQKMPTKYTPPGLHDCHRQRLVGGAVTETSARYDFAEAVTLDPRGPPQPMNIVHGALMMVCSTTTASATRTSSSGSNTMISNKNITVLLTVPRLYRQESPPRRTRPPCGRAPADRGSSCRRRRRPSGRDLLAPSGSGSPIIASVRFCWASQRASVSKPVRSSSAVSCSSGAASRFALSAIASKCSNRWSPGVSWSLGRASWWRCRHA